MITSRAPASRPPTGSTGTDVHSDPLLDELRRGEREAFQRYFELHRAPVYDLLSRLLDDAEDAVSATQEVFTRVYRRILLQDGPLDLRGWTYRAAIDVCRERLSEREGDRGAEGGHEADGRDAGGRLRRTAPSDLGRRFGQALEMVEFRHQAVLLLHDVNGLGPAEMAIVFGVTEDAASALLFRAREEFRRAFEGLSSDRRDAACRLAEQTAAGAVGRSLSDDEVRRLGEHAGYCKECRRTMKGWGAGAIGLALFLGRAPLPQELATTPVFGTAMPVAGASNGVAHFGTLTRMFARIGRSLTSRAAAYALAGVCLAVAVGLAVQQSPGDRAFILAPVTQPRGPAFVQPGAIVVRPLISRSGQTVARTSRSSTGSPRTVESHAGATVPMVTTVAAIDRQAISGRPTVGHPTAASAAEPGASALRGNGKGHAKTPKDDHGSAGPGHSGQRNGSHAKPVSSHHSEATRYAHGGREQHAKQTNKNESGKRQERTKTTKSH